MNEAFLAHELRRPLTLLKGYAELLDQKSEVVQKMSRVTDELNDVLEALLRLHRPRRALVNLAALAGQSGEVWIEGDPVLLTLALQNLLENARRYGKAPVVVAVEEMGVEVALSVTDAGVGRAPTQGWGLGHELVREIAEAHGGRFEIKGARFSVILPRAKTPVESIHPEIATAPSYDRAALTPQVRQ